MKAVSVTDFGAFPELYSDYHSITIRSYARTARSQSRGEDHNHKSRGECATSHSAVEHSTSTTPPSHYKE